MTKSAEYLIRQALQEKQAYPAVLQAGYEKVVQPIARGIEKAPSLMGALLRKLRGTDQTRNAAALAYKRMMAAKSVANYTPRVQIPQRPMVGAGS